MEGDIFMALIKCPECEKNVSDKANACIHCGFPLNSPKGELVIRGKRTSDVLKKHIYFLYENGAYFDEVLPGEVKRYPVDKTMHLVLGHKKGSFINSAVKDSSPVIVEPGRITRLEASIGQGFMPSYFLSKVDIIDAE